jgi:hypothetical protein
MPIQDFRASSPVYLMALARELMTCEREENRTLSYLEAMEREGPAFLDRIRELWARWVAEGTE